MKRRTEGEIKTVLVEILDRLERIEEQGHIEETLMLGAFADGLAFCLGENMARDYVEMAKHLAGPERIKRSELKIV